MKNKNQALTRKFKKFLDEETVAFMNPENGLITFPYEEYFHGESKKESMVIMLIFWKFLRNLSASITFSEKRDFISFFLENNQLAKKYPKIKIVAMIESLPTTIWRRLLWRENIDFVSYEACLRRLTLEQKQAIEDNYNDLFSIPEPSVPRVLKKSWRDRIKLFFGIISVDKILSEVRPVSERQASKGAWAFSLLSLDFGFSLYPKGDNDDTKITNKKWTRFLSVKEHINDFIVNQEDGKYWWLYRTARSNYAINPNKKVNMKSHVCPGFWMTLIIHTLFWIVSPISLIITGITVAKYGLSYESISPAIFAIAMIVWSIVAFFKTIIILIIKLIGKIEKDSLTDQIIKISVITIVLAFLACVAGFIIYLIIKGTWLTITCFAPICGPLLSVLFVLSAIFYAFFFFACVAKDSPLFKYRDIPIFIRFLLHLAIGSFILVTFDKFLSTPIINFMVNTAKGLWSWYTSDLLITNWLILAFCFMAGVAYFDYIFLTNEKKFANSQKTIKFFSFIFFLFTALVALAIFLRTDFVIITDLGLMPLAVLSFIFLALGLIIYMLEKVNKDTIDEREKASEFILKIDNKITGWAYKGYISQVLSSKWLGDLGDRKWLVVMDIKDLAFYFFKNDSGYRISFTELIIRRGSVEILNLLDDLKELEYDSGYSNSERLKIIELVINGAIPKKAIETIMNNRSSSEKFIRKAKFVAKSAALPFVFSYQAVRWTLIKIKQFFLTLADIWSLFNKRCPFIAQSKYLE